MHCGVLRLSCILGKVQPALILLLLLQDFQQKSWCILHALPPGGSRILIFVFTRLLKALFCFRGFLFLFLDSSLVHPCNFTDVLWRHSKSPPISLLASASQQWSSMGARPGIVSLLTKHRISK